MKKLLSVVALGVFCVLISSCTNQSESSPRVGKIKISRSPSLAAMECFLVNVRGTNVKQSFQAVDLHDKYEMSCLGLGTVSKLASPTAAETTGIEFEVRSGPARTIEVYGITQGAGASACDGSTLDQVLNTGASLYLVGSTLVDLTVDAAVSIQAKFDPTSAVDKGKVCRNDILPASRFTISGSASPSVNTCTKYTVSTQNALDETTAVTAETPLTLTFNGSGAIYSDSNCLAQDPLKIPAESNTTDFYFKDTIAEDVTFSLSAQDFTTKNRLVTVAAGSPVNVSLPADDSIAAGQCKAYTVRMVDTFGNSASVASDVTITFSQNGSGGIFNNSGCSTPLTSKAIASGTSSTQFYFKNMVAEDVVVTASAPGLRLLTDDMTITTSAGSVSSLQLPTDASITAGVCTTYTVKSTDSLGNPVNVSSNTAVSLASTGTGAFFTNSGCGTPASSVTISSGSSSANLFFKNDTAQTVTITASTSRLRLNSDTMDITTAAASLTSLKLPADDTITAGACTTYPVKATDNYGNSVNVSNDTTVNLSSTGSGAFYTTSGCTALASFVTIGSGTSTTNLFFKNAVAETVTVTASATGLRLNSDTMDITANAGSVTNLKLPADDTITAGACTTYVLRSTDSLGNPTNVASNTAVNLTSTGTGAFYTNSSCGTPAVSVQIDSGTNSTNVYFKNDTAQTVTITAGTAGLRLTSDSMDITTQAAAVSSLKLPADDSIAAGACTTYAVQSVDDFGNPASVASSTTINLASSGAGKFFTTSGCTTQASSVTILGSASSANLFFKNDTAETVTVTASTSRLRLNSDTMSITTAVGSVTDLRLPADDLITAGDCATYVLRSTDSLGNPANVASNTTVNLTSTGAGKFYTNNGCTTQASSVQIDSGTNLTNVYFKNDTAEIATITASTSRLRLTSDTMDVTTQAAALSSLKLPADDSITAGACTTYSVKSTDNFGNLVNVVTDTTVSLASTGSGKFYTTSGCSSLASSVTITAEMNSATLYFKNDTAETVTVTASTSRKRLNSDTMIITTAAGSVARLNFPTNNSIAAGECKEYGLTTTDSAGNSAKVSGSALAINLTSTGNGHFYENSSCITSTTTATIAVDSASTSVFFRNDTAQTVDVTASAASLRIANADMAITTLPLTASKLVLPPDATIGTDECTAYSVKTTDTFGNLSDVATDTQITYTTSAGSLFSNAGCSNLLTSVTIPANNQPANFYFKNSAAAAATISVNSERGKREELSGDSMVVTTVAPVFAKLLLPSTSFVAAGTCVKHTVTAAAANGVTTTVTTNTTVDLSSTQADTIYGTGCATPITSVVIAQNQSTADFYISSTAAGTATVNASVSGGSITEAEMEVTITAGSFAKLKLPAAQNTTAGTCLPIVVNTTDSFGNLKTLGNDTSIAITSTGSGKMYSNIGCTSEITSFTAIADTDLTTVYFRNESAETATINASVPGRGRITPASTSVTTSAAALAKVMLPADTTNQSGDCLPIAVTAADTFGNPKKPGTQVTVNLSKSGSGAFYNNPECTTPTSLVTVEANATTGTFYYQHLGVQGDTITATPPLGIDSDSMLVTTTAAAAAKLVLPLDESHTVGACVEVLVKSLDQYGNPSAVTADTTVTLTNNKSGKFYELSNCNTEKSTVTILATESSASFYYRNTKAEADDITASSLLRLAPDTMTITSTAGPVAGLLLPDDFNTPAGTCTEILLKSVDGYGNPKAVTNDLPVTFLITQSSRRMAARKNGSRIPKRTGQIFLTAACASPVGQVVIPQDSDQTTFYFSDTTAEVVNINASATGSRYSDDMKITVTTGSPSVLEFPANNQVLSGACTAYTVRTKDAYGNYANVSPALTILVNSTTNTLYSDSECSNALGGGFLTIPDNTNEATFYYRDNGTATQTINGTKTGYTSNSMTVTAVPNKIVLFGPTSFNAGGCTAMNLATKDNSGSTAPVAALKKFDLSDDRGATFYVETSCATPTTQLSLGASQSLLNFGYSTTKSGSHVITAVDNAAVMTGTTRTISVDPLSASKIGISGDSVLNALQCKPYQVEVQDSYGNNTAANTPISVSMMGAPGQIYSDAQCSNAYSLVGIPSGSLGGTTYLKPKESQQIFLQGASALNTASLSIAARGGILDTSFGTSGLIVTSMGTGGESANRLVRTQDGKLLAAGFATTPSTTHDFALASYETTGELSLFGASGRAYTTVSSIVDDEIYGATVAADGKILVAGAVNSMSDHNAVIARYTTTGALDNSFGVNGISILNLLPGGNDQARDIAVYGDGTIIAVGNRSDCGFEWQWISLSGSPISNVVDCTVGGGAPKGLIITANGEAVAVGQGYNSEIAIQRQAPFPYGYDPSFNGSGKVLTTLGDESALNAVVKDTNGKYVVAGFVKEAGDHNFLVARYLTTGQLDTSFNHVGYAINTISPFTDIAQSIVMQTDGKILAVGVGKSPAKLVMTRYTWDGAIDTLFGTDGSGVVVTSIGSTSQANSAIIQGDGKIVVGGATTGPDAFLMGRYIP